MNYLSNLMQAIDYDFLWSWLRRLIAVLVCLTIHETCHGLAAYALGDPTAKHQHRLSLNPLRHIDWFGFAMMLVAGFGWAKPVPVDARYFKKPKQGMALTALAGPGSNLVLALLLLVAVRCMLYSIPLWLAYFMLETALLSVGLGLFNLLPIPPLDGSKVLFSLLPDEQYRWLMRYERFGILLLLALSLSGAGGAYLSRAIYAVFEALCRMVGL